MSVDRGCGITGPCLSPPEAVLSCPWVGLRGPTVLWFKDQCHGESPPLWSTSHTHIPSLFVKAPGGDWGLTGELCLWSHSDSTMMTNWHGDHQISITVYIYTEHLLISSPLLVVTTARASELLWHTMDINRFWGGLHGVLGTASLSKKEHVLGMRLLICLLWLRMFFGCLVGLNWRMM